jgi:hypothetical protein
MPYSSERVRHFRTSPSSSRSKSKPSKEPTEAGGKMSEMDNGNGNNTIQNTILFIVTAIKTSNPIRVD